jgi:hypothetical protein
MITTVAKTEKRLKTLTEKVGASEEGRIWLENCLDPFCDQPRRAVGFPDLITGNSIVQVIKQSITYANSSGAAEDVHIFNDQVDQQVQMAIVKRDDGTAAAGTNSLGWILNPSPTSVQNRGGVRIRAAANGTPLNETHDVGGASLDATFFRAGSTRVLSKGFEVHNTTPPLEQGGAVIVYRDATKTSTNPPEIGSFVGSPTTDIRRDFPARHLPEVPETPAQCFILPGSQQWEAKDGCMVISTMDSQTNEPEEDPRGLLYFHDSANTVGDDWLTWPINLLQVSATGPYVPYLDREHVITPSPFFVSGAFFTGLPDKSTLTINVIWIIERFVDHSNKDLVVLASPSPSYDPVALELYSKTAHRLPAGVKVSMNADGDWIKDIADTLGDFGIPGMGIVKGAVNVGQKIFGGQEAKNLERTVADLANRVEKFENHLMRHDDTIDSLLKGGGRMNVPQYLPPPISKNVNSTQKSQGFKTITNSPQNFKDQSIKTSNSPLRNTKNQKEESQGKSKALGSIVTRK